MDSLIAEEYSEDLGNKILNIIECTRSCVDTVLKFHPLRKDLSDKILKLLLKFIEQNLSLLKQEFKQLQQSKYKHAREVLAKDLNNYQSITDREFDLYKMLVNSNG